MVEDIDPPNPEIFEYLFTHGNGKHIYNMRKHRNRDQTIEEKEKTLLKL